jgi:small-conductance mechanosensitive channel
MLSRILRPLALASLLALASPALLQAEPAAAPERIETPTALADPTFTDPEATLEIWNRPIVTFRAGFGSRTPERRAEMASQRIADLPFEALLAPVEALPIQVGELRGVQLHAGAHYLFSLAEADLDAESGESFDAFVGRARQNLAAALEARAAQSEGRVLLRGLAVAVPATLVFLVLVWALMHARRFVAARAAAVSAQQLQKLSPLSFDVRRQVALLMRFGADALAWTLSGVAAYLWLTLVLVEFPYTEPWGRELGGFLRDTVVGLARGFLEAVPGLVVIGLIFLITRGAVALASSFFENVERGRVRSSWFDAETARATRRLVGVLLWIFAVTAAYPHIPGSNTDAFKGISVFVGLVVSLGATGLVNQIMSGFVVVYSRALRPGDWVRVGEVEGLVKEVGMLSTKLTTVRQEEVAIPNAVLVATATTNFTSLTGVDGPLVSTAVTIGYDVPWRQVHALLALAASRTKGLRPQPEPRVLQRGLSDYYVEYQLIAHLERADDRYGALSDLHANIQDAFNEHGVQIMSPHFVMQPAAPVLVPKQKWFEAPAAAAAAPASGSAEQRAG